MPTDDSNELPSTPYTTTRTFAGAFEAGDLKTPQLSIEVAYSTVNGHPPTGIVRGTSAEYRQLEAFFMAQRGAGCTLRSVSKERESITCTGIRLHRITEKHFAKDKQSTIQQLLAYFVIEQIDIRMQFRNPAEEKGREATFLLSGPSNVWLIYSSKELSYTGQVTVKHGDPALPIDSTRDRVSTAPHFVYAEHPQVRGALRETHQAQLFSLKVDDAFEMERDGAAFVEETTALADKLCLLMSFLSKAYITWFTRTYSDGGEFLQSYRRVRTTDSDDPDWEDLVLSPPDIRPFLSQALSGYDTRTASGFDLRIPILYYVYAQSSRFVEDRLTTLFLALEKLLSSLDADDPEDDLLSRSELSTLWKAIRPALEEMGKTPKQIDLVLAKRRELQRAPLMHRIERHLNSLNIDITDIGGFRGVRKLVAVRNLLAHDKGEVPIDTVIYETHRLETIVERMLLKLLSWEGKTLTPTYNNRPVRGENA